MIQSLLKGNISIGHMNHSNWHLFKPFQEVNACILKLLLFFLFSSEIQKGSSLVDPHFVWSLLNQLTTGGSPLMNKIIVWPV